MTRKVSSSNHDSWRNSAAAGRADAVEGLGRVGEAAVGLHAEAKTWRSLGRPVEQGRLGRGAVEAAVELDAVEPLGVIPEHLRAGERGRVERALPARIAEAG